MGNGEEEAPKRRRAQQNKSFDTNFLSCHRGFRCSRRRFPPFFLSRAPLVISVSPSVTICAAVSSKFRAILVPECHSHRDRFSPLLASLPPDLRGADGGRSHRKPKRDCERVFSALAEGENLFRRLRFPAGTPFRSIKMRFAPISAVSESAALFVSLSRGKWQALGAEIDTFVCSGREERKRKV